MTQNQFTTIISASDQASPLLPMAHTCDGWRLRTIISENRLNLPKEPCDVYNEHLNYFFYGRPGYRGHSSNKSTSTNSMYLASLILDPTTAPKPKRILPFDSGAFNKELFSDYMHPEMKLEHFEIYEDVFYASRIVSCFFGTNQNYWKGNSKTDLKFKPLEFEAECYRNLIESKSNSAYDDRRSCIEIQMDQKIDFSATKVLALVIPECFADDENIYKFSNRLNADLITYECYHAQPNEDARSITDKTYEYLKNKGIL